MRVSLLVLGALPVLAYVYLFHLRALPLVIANGGDHLAAYYTSNSIDSVVVGPVQTRDDALNDDHVRIKVAFAALNPADKKLLGLPLACSSRPPHVCGLGIEGSGIVEKVGSNAASAFKEGDRVFFVTGPGNPTLQPYVHVTKEQVGHVPQQWSLRSAALMPIVTTTSMNALEKCGELSGDVLIVGGNSATGRQAIQLIKLQHDHVFRIIAVCGNETMCLNNGASHVINYHKETLEQGLQRLKVEKLSMVYETIFSPSTWDVTQKYHPSCYVDIDMADSMSLKGMISFVGNLIVRNAKALLGQNCYYRAFLNSVDGKLMHSLSSLMSIHDFHGEIGKDFPFTTEGVRDGLHHLGSGGKPVFAILKRKK